MSEEDLQCSGNAERTLAVLKNVGLDGKGKGRLLLTGQTIAYEARNGLFSRTKTELTIDLAAVSSAVRDEASNELVVEWLDDQEYCSVTFRLPKGHAAEFGQALNELLEQMRADEELERRKAEYVDFLWGTAYDVWVLTGLLIETVEQLTLDDWAAVDGLAEQINESVRNGLSLPRVSVHSLADSLASRDGPLVLREVSDILRAIGSTLNDELCPADEWGELVLDEGLGIKWRDIRFIYLFALSHRLLPLARRLCNREELENTMHRLQRFGLVLSETLMEQANICDMQDAELEDLAAGVDETAYEVEQSLKERAGVA